MLEVKYTCDGCGDSATHRYQSKPAILSRKEHGWAWVKVTDESLGFEFQKLLCSNCTSDDDTILRNGK